MTEQIIEALNQLDPLNDEHWTADGAPKMDIVNDLIESEDVVTRQDVVDAAPSFTKDNMVIEGTPEDKEEMVDIEFDSSMSNSQVDQWVASLNPDELCATVEALAEERNSVTREIENLKQSSSIAKRAINLAKVRIKLLIPGTSDAESIKKFIESQTRARADRVKRRDALLGGLDIKMSDLDPRSPIDSAMSRKIGRGKTRPARS